MPSYPDVYIPSGFSLVSQSNPRVPFPPREPFKPVTPKTPQWWSTSFVGFITVFIFLAVLRMPIILGIGLASFLAIGTKLFQSWLYQKALRDFRVIKKEYPSLVLVYQKEKQDHEILCEKLLSPENIKIHRLEALEGFKKQIYPPDGYQSNAPKGCCEARLERTMGKYLKGRIFSSATLDIPNYQYPFTSDICYEINGLYIDIEVDEPYYKRDGDLIPYHGYDEWKDGNRNSFFVGKTWIVIRFAEEQVARYPDSCVKTIALIISDITGESIPQSLVNIPDLSVMPRWTTADAQRLISDNYRDTYIHLCR